MIELYQASIPANRSSRKLTTSLCDSTAATGDNYCPIRAEYIIDILDCKLQACKRQERPLPSEQENKKSFATQHLNATFFKITFVSAETTDV